jgi:putative phosphoribosyl transferase
MIKEDREMFKNREEASKRLISEIPLNICTLDNVIVLAISEGGVFFADRLAKKLNSQFDILLTEPIYSEVNEELIIAMVGETEEIVMHKALTDSFAISKDYIYGEAHHKYESNILTHIDKYRKGIKLQDLDDKYVILIDECVETGLTMMTAVKTAISLGAKNIFIAVPVLDNVVYKNLVTICDNIFCPLKIDDYISIEYYYEDINPFSFEEIEMILKNKNNQEKNTKDEGTNV